MGHTFVIYENDDELLSDEVFENDRHQLKTSADKSNGDIYLEFSSRESMRDFALTLLHESIYGQGSIELFPLGYDGKLHVVNGARLAKHSSRVFIEYPSRKHTSNPGDASWLGLPYRCFAATSQPQSRALAEYIDLQRVA